MRIEPLKRTSSYLHVHGMLEDTALVFPDAVQKDQLLLVGHCINDYDDINMSHWSFEKDFI